MSTIVETFIPNIMRHKAKGAVLLARLEFMTPRRARRLQVKYAPSRGLATNDSSSLGRLRGGNRENPCFVEIHPHAQ